MNTTINLGQTIGQLTVVATAPPRNNQTAWYCRCGACGRKSLLLAKDMLSGGKEDCGCVRRKKRKATRLASEQRQKRKREKRKDGRTDKGSLVPRSVPENAGVPKGVFVIATASPSPSLFAAQKLPLEA